MQGPSVKGFSLQNRTEPRVFITLTHVSLLSALALGLSVNCVLGAFAGYGAYPFLSTNHLAAVGLLQAYLLMALIGVAVWTSFLTTHHLHQAWHYLVITAHLPPLLALFLLTPSTPELTLNVVLLSLAVHGAGIAAEVIALSLRRTKNV